MKVDVTRHAREDILSIGDYLAEENLAAGIRLVDDLFSRCDSLEKTPERGSPIARLDGLILRRLVHGQYLIIYAVASGMVRVYRVIHGARSPRLLLKDLDLS